MNSRFPDRFVVFGYSFNNYYDSKHLNMRVVISSLIVWLPNRLRWQSSSHIRPE